MRPFISCVLSFVVFCGLTQVGEAALVITEIMNNPSDASDGNTNNSAEWFELYNSGASAVNLSTIKVDDDANASDGAALNGSLGSHKYAIVANLSQATWVGLYGGLPTGTLFVQLPNPWNVLNNGPGDTISLYNTVTSSSFFQLDYTSSTNGRSLEYTGTTVSGVAPYSALWVHTTTIGGGSSGDRHTAGSSNIQSAPEPASFALLGLAALGLFTVVRRQRLAELAE